MEQILLEQYLQALTRRLDEIRNLVRKYHPGDAETEAKIRSVAHSLHGSGSSFGYPRITELARLCEHAPKAELLGSLALLVKEIRLVTGTAESVTGNASTPPVPDTESAPKPAALAPAAGPGKHVLIVEDDDSYATLISGALYKLDPEIKITRASTAEAAQAAVVHSVFTLIILDLILPDRDGRDLLYDMKKEYQLAAPVLILSGITKDLVRVECMSLGADKFIHKPIDQAELVRNLKPLLQKSYKPALSLVPKGSELKKAEPALGETARELATKTILVVEDDKMQAKLILQQLGKEGIAIEHAENGRHALQCLRQKTYSLVILDIQMPMVSGFEVLEKLRTELELKTLPVIILSAMGSEQDIIRGYDLGANDYILKPYSSIQLVARVKSLLKTRVQP